MIMGDRKKIMTVILGAKHGAQDSYAADESPFKDVAKQILTAIESKSEDSLANALEAFCNYLEARDAEQDAR